MSGNNTTTNFQTCSSYHLFNWSFAQIYVYVWCHLYTWCWYVLDNPHVKIYNGNLQSEQSSDKKQHEICHFFVGHLNTLRPRQNGCHFTDDSLKYIFLNENVIISAKISLKFVPKGPINNIPILVQTMAWRRPGDKPLSGPMMIRLLTYICVTWPQWVKQCYLISRIVSEISDNLSMFGSLEGQKRLHSAGILQQSTITYHFMSMFPMSIWTTTWLHGIDPEDILT